MKNVLIDTGIWIDYLNGKNNVVHIQEILKIYEPK
jgi:hypothetical protein